MFSLSTVMGLAPGWVVSGINLIYFTSCVVLMGFILMQRGKGGGGLAFGMSGSTQSVVGSSTADNILRKVTKISAGTFMACALLLASHNANKQASVMDIPVPKAVTAPTPAEEETASFTFTPKEEGQPEAAPTEAAPSEEAPAEPAPIEEPTPAE